MRLINAVRNTQAIGLSAIAFTVLFAGLEGAIDLYHALVIAAFVLLTAVAHLFIKE